MLRINAAIAIPEDELVERFKRASGPGGQNVNKVASAVELRFDVEASSALPPPAKARLRRLAGGRMTKDGVIVITARTQRSQEANRRAARQRLAVLIRQATRAPTPRKPTHPSRAAKERRLHAKKLRGTRKARRKPPAPEE